MATIFQFTWANIKDGKDHTILSYDKNHIKLFLTQHGFDPNTAHVSILDDTDIDDGLLLYEYTFGSRKRDRTYKIFTSYSIIEFMVNYVAADLNEAMTFGSCALRGEIEIFDKISKLVDLLDYVYILDGIKAESEGYDTYDSEEYINGYPYYESFAKDRDSSLLYDSLHDDSYHGKPIQPITIETYVSIFTTFYLIGK